MKKEITNEENFLLEAILPRRRPKGRCHLKRKERDMETTQTTGTKTMKQQMSDIQLAVSWGDLARTYFTKSASWFYHKMDGRDGNKKPTEFTMEERAQLKGALIDLSDRIRHAADSIEI